MPDINTKKYSFGPGRVFLGAPGETPSKDVGSVRSGAELTVTRERLEVYQGSPRTLVKQYVTNETAQLVVTGIEWDLELIAQAIGYDPNVAVGGTSGLTITLGLGGDMDVSQVALRFQHVTPVGATIMIDFFKAEGSGEFKNTFGDELHEFPYTFKAIAATCGWAGVSDILDAKKSLLRMIYIKAPSEA
jgi:hypothetical protein